MEIGQKIKDARTRAGLTQEQVAEKVMVSRQTISNWENGKSLPDIVSVIKLSDLYQISLDELLKGEEMKKKVEKDAKLSRDRQRVIMVNAIVVLAFGIIYLVSLFVGGNFYDFWSSAMPYLLIGMGALLAIMLEGLKDDSSGSGK